MKFTWLLVSYCLIDAKLLKVNIARVIVNINGFSST